MRLWTIHPNYLDAKGLVALWREGLLARKVLMGLTKGYKFHPQLERFKKSESPLTTIDAYLTQVLFEAERRHYSFDSSKIRIVRAEKILKVREGQLRFEFNHLLKKLKERDPQLYRRLAGQKRIIANPVFRKVRGGIEEWEKIE